MRNQTRRGILAGLAGGLLRAQTKRPNIVLILFDDLGWKDFSCYGNTTQKTPNIDAIAAEGVRFTQAYAACPVCSPSRAALLTGKYPPRTGVTDWIAGRPQWPTAKLVTPRTKTELALDEVTAAERFRDLGYRTASIGKWHLGGANGFLPTHQGFDVNVGGNQRGSSPYFGPFDMPGLEGRTKQDYLTRELGKAARQFVAASSQPFFLYSPNYAVHLPLQAPGFEGSKGTYAEMLRIADEEIGLLRDTLKKAGTYDNTTWVITSDNGGLLYEGKSQSAITDNKPLRAGKGHLYEGGIRVPLIIKPAGSKPRARTVPDRVCGIDILPTLLDLGGQPESRDIDGKSLKPLLEGKNLASRPLYWHYPHYSNQGGVPGGVVIEKNWKLIHFYEDGRNELFDLSKDPSESKNLAASESGRAARMLKQLDEWKRSVGAIDPKENPAFDAAKSDQGLFGKEPPTPAR
jgi:arylsulfatase A